MNVSTCSSDGCDKKPVESLVLRGQPGHVHDCAEHAHDLREWCDVIGSKVIVDGFCYYRPCTGDVAIFTGRPTPLEAE